MYDLNKKQKKFWVEKVFTHGNDYIDLNDSDCSYAPQFKEVSRALESIKGNKINLIEVDNGRTKNGIYSVGFSNILMVEADSIIDMFAPSGAIILASVYINRDEWRTNIIMKDYKVYEIVSMSVEDDTEIILYSKGRPVREMKRESTRQGQSISNKYSFKFY